jgi:hypothetical protein
VIDAARELAWLPHANLPRGRVYWERKEKHERLVEALRNVRLPAGASIELVLLLEAIRRVAAASYSNRFGEPYMERRQAMAMLRGALDSWHRTLAERAVA